MHPAVAVILAPSQGGWSSASSQLLEIVAAEICAPTFLIGR